MKKKINERYEMEKKYKCEYVYICDTCGHKSEYDFRFKIETPDTHTAPVDYPSFCSVECMAKYFSSKEIDNIESGYKLSSDEEENYLTGKFYLVKEMSLENWRKFLKVK